MEPTQKNQQGTKPASSRSVSVIRLYADMSKDSRLLFFSALSLLAVSLLIYLLFALAIGKLVDGTLAAYIGETNTDDGMASWNINQWAWVLFVLLLLNVICNFFESSWFQIIGERAAATLRLRLLDRLVHLPMSFYSSTRSGDLSSRILADVSLLQEAWINDVRNAISYTAMLTGAVIMLFVISPSLAIFVFLVAPPVVALTVWFGKKISSGARRVQNQLGQTSVIAEEAILGIHRVKTFANEDYENHRFGVTMNEYLSSAIGVARHRAGLFSAILFILMGSSIFLMWYGSLQIQQKKLSPGDFTSFMFFLSFMGNAGGLLAQLAGRVQRMTGAAQRVSDILKEEQEDPRDDSPATLSKKIKGDIEFCDISFSYPGRDQVTALNGINLHLQAGKCVAIVGPSGAGKSTLAALLFRLFEPSQGVLKIDGENAKSYSLLQLRNQMAMVPQEILLFGGTIAENIAYGRPDAGHEEVIKAAQQANALEFIEQLPQGFDTPAGDQGIQLSGGQRQRIAIARAILRNPTVLVLDEATSSLDSKNEQLVQKALASLIQNRTCLVIAHRLSTVRRADKIIVMKEGTIIEQGSHDELYQAAGFYRHLCDEQQSLL